jgi:hypothetical protein
MMSFKIDFFLPFSTTLFLEGGGGTKRTAMAWDSKIWNLMPRKYDLKHFGGEILQNSEDYKVHQTHDFLPDISLRI